MKIVNKVSFPKHTGIKCNMMPFIQGDSSSLPEQYQPYAEIIQENFLEKGLLGFLTIDEAFVEAGASQRGYNSKNINRNIHIEVGHEGLVCSWGDPSLPAHWGSTHWSRPSPRHAGHWSRPPHWGGHWGSSARTLLEHTTKVLIANSLSDTCRVWDKKEFRPTLDGDLSDYVDDYPEETGRLLKAGEMAEISIFTPHECVPQKDPGFRQFFRIVGQGVIGREPYFTQNPLVDY